MLLHAFGARAGAGDILAAAAGDSGPGGTRFADVALLSATSIGFALGAATTGQFKHLTAAAAGPLAGMASLPGLRTLPPRPAAVAGGGGPPGRPALCARAPVGGAPAPPAGCSPSWPRSPSTAAPGRWPGRRRRCS